MPACRRYTPCSRPNWKCLLPQKHRRQLTALSTSPQQRLSCRAGACLMVCQCSNLG